MTNVLTLFVQRELSHTHVLAISDFGEECEDVRLDDVSIFFPDLTLYLLCDFIQCEVSEERNYVFLQN